MSKTRTYIIETVAEGHIDFDTVDGTGFWVSEKDGTLVIYATDENGVRRRAAAFARNNWLNITEAEEDEEPQTGEKADSTGIDIASIPPFTPPSYVFPAPPLFPPPFLPRDPSFPGLKHKHGNPGTILCSCLVHSSECSPRIGGGGEGC